MRRWLVVQTQPAINLPDPIEADEWIEGEYFTRRGALKACTARGIWQARL